MLFEVTILSFIYFLSVNIRQKNESLLFIAHLHVVFWVSRRRYRLDSSVEIDANPKK